MKKYICKNSRCKKKFYRYSSTVRNKKRVFCSKKCKETYFKFHKCNAGIFNSNFKNGNYIKNSYCDCGNARDYRAKECASCAKRGHTKVGVKNRNTIPYNKLKILIQKSKSLLEVASRLGTSRHRIKLLVLKYKFNISHFKKCRGRVYARNEIFLQNGKKNYTIVRRILLEEKLLKYKCHVCGLKPFWKGKKLVLQVHHINGNSKDNRLKNLMFICPNCHSQTLSYKGKNMKKKEEKKVVR